MKSIAAALLAAGLSTMAAAQDAQPAPNPANADYHFAYLNRLDPAQGWHRTASGLRYRRVGAATGGAHPAADNNVTIRYTGRFIDGSTFDSSGDETATFPLNRLIPGWQEGVPMMAIGERWEFAIPYTLAYGWNGRGPIPGGATLVFTIDLVAIAPRG